MGGPTNGSFRPEDGTAPPAQPPALTSVPRANGAATAVAEAAEAERPRALSIPRMVLDAGILTSAQVRQAQQDALRDAIPFARLLSRDGLILSRELATLIAFNLGLPMVNLRSETIDINAVSLLPEDLARRYFAMPVKRQGNLLAVALVDPTDLQILQDLKACTGCNVMPLVATPEDILEHINSFYRRVHQTPGKSDDDTPVIQGRLSAQTIRQVPPAQVINLLLHQAIQDRASDIHILASEEELRIRFRIDGILHDVMSLPLELHPTLISRLKIVSGMNIAERRRPQDGQFSNDFQGRPVDVRVAISNTVTGEMAVLRLLDKNFTIRGLDQIGMRSDVLTPYRKLLKLPYGMVIVCGPTGAGKSTTLYAPVLQTNRSEQNIISLEDPVEYRIKDIGQMQVHPEAGVTFALQLRSVLRLDPDVIQVGEIRDQETAVIATHAALTGHLVLTSLHANDSVSALMRLRDLGVAPYLISSSVVGIISQRMVRRICTSCQTSKTGDAAEQKAYLAEMGQPRNQFIVGAGCNMCAHTGYYGRTGVFELLVVTDTIRQMFLDDQPRDRILEEALKEGLVPMRRDGMMKVKEGVTTPYEVMRVLFSLESADPA